MKLQFCMDLGGVGVKTVPERPGALKPQKILPNGAQPRFILKRAKEKCSIFLVEGY